MLCALGASSVAACEDRWGYSGYGYGHYRPYICNQYSSCGSCTPVAGCGWCSFPGGGACLASPSECSVTEFTWTWERSGCEAEGDAGPAEKDAAPPVSEPKDAASTD